MKSVIACLVVLLLSVPAFAGPRVAVVIGEKPPALERLAADELANQLHRVYEADVKIGSTAPADAPYVIFVGSPDTNASMKPFAASWPSGDQKLTDQGHLLRSVTHNNKPALLIGGGSPVATYWAVAEFGHHLGIRSMFFGDLDPVSPPEFRLDGIDLVLQPAHRVRGWEFVNVEPMAAGAWGLAEYRQMLRQLAKRKFNHVRLRLFASEPWVHFESGRVQRQSAAMWRGERFPVSGDTLGRKPFGGAKLFENPEFVGAESYADRIKAGNKLLSGVIDAAHEFGLKVTCEVPLRDFPIEFQLLVKPAFKPWLGALEYSADFPAQGNDRTMIELAQAQWAAYRGCRGVDAFEFRGLWNKSDRQTLRRVLDISGLDRGPVIRSLQRRHDVIVSAPLLSLDGQEELNDETAGIAELQLDRPGFYLPSITTSKLPDQLQVALKQGRDGYWAYGASIGDVDFPAYWLSRAGFGETLTTAAALRQLLDPVCGDGVHERVALAFASAEQALALIDQRPSPEEFSVGMNLKNSFPTFLKAQEKPPESWAKIQEHYLTAMNEMYRANTRARDGGRPFSLYFARRFEFAYEYMGAITAARNAGLADWQMQHDKVIPNLEKAIESLNNGLNAIAAVARSNSDRGLIAVLNEYGYRPLKKKLTEAEAAK